MAEHANNNPKEALLAELVNRVTEDPVDLLIYLLRFLKRDRPFQEEAVSELLNCAYQDCEDYPEQYSDALFFAGNYVTSKGYQSSIKLDKYYTFPNFREDLRSDAHRFAELATNGAETDAIVPLVKEVAMHYFSWCYATIEGFLSDEDASAMVHLLRKRGSTGTLFLVGEGDYLPLCLLLPRDGKAPIFCLDAAEAYP